MNARNIEYCKQRDVTCFKLNEFFVSENITCDTLAMIANGIRIMKEISLIKLVYKISSSINHNWDKMCTCNYSQLGNVTQLRVPDITANLAPYMSTMSLIILHTRQIKS